jgi:hypothetical protein
MKVVLSIAVCKRNLYLSKSGRIGFFFLSSPSSDPVHQGRDKVVHYMRALCLGTETIKVPVTRLYIRLVRFVA